MNLKIREAQMQKVPYMLVVGDSEMGDGTASVRLRSGENLGPLSLDALAERMNDEIIRKV
jgi:threonyl-tRNA synthetase